MPNVWAHLIFGEEVLKRVGDPGWLERRETRNLFRFGCQGPDPLFYYNFLPWQNKELAGKLGNAMHEENCGHFLIQMFRHLRGGGMEDPAWIYGCGFLLHHVLDRNAHPYIFAKSGFRPWDHQRFEVILDTLVAARLRGIRTWKTPVWRELEIPGGLPAEVARLLQALAAEFYPLYGEAMNASDWSKAYRDMIAAHKLFHDPWGLKRALTFGRIEPMVYKKKNAPLDYENEARAAWTDPVDGVTEYRDSFQELWEHALDDGVRVLRQAFRYRSSIRDVPDPSELEEEWKLAGLIGNVSYSTGRPCGSGDIRHASPIWEDARAKRSE